ncbi:MAG TPA: hypothetical protein VFF69_04970 [Phycisphaerales bacterium]|nr:hypothetical protein [Phycisphaerales bacterium]
MTATLHQIGRLLGALLGGAALSLAVAQPAAEPGTQQTTPAGPRFGYVDVFIDSGATPLAVYQVELRATEGDIRIVGVEGGDAGPFVEPPHYDPKALLDGERIVLGDFSTDADLPAGHTRIARVHLRIDGPAPTLALTLDIAGDADANAINAQTSYEASFQTQNGSNP